MRILDNFCVSRGSQTTLGQIFESNELPPLCGVHRGFCADLVSHCSFHEHAHFCSIFLSDALWCAHHNCRLGAEYVR